MAASQSIPVTTRNRQAAYSRIRGLCAHGRLVETDSRHLAPDGWELAEVTQISGRPVYAPHSRLTVPSALRHVKKTVKAGDTGTWSLSVRGSRPRWSRQRRKTLIGSPVQCVPDAHSAAKHRSSKPGCS
jgi:hypothetical protein